jgi:enterochelin esterase-like enzyme
MAPPPAAHRLQALPPRPPLAVVLWRALQSIVGGWAYRAEAGRDVRIDLLRGMAVLAMIIDHIAGPSRLYLITGGNRFYTSAAEGFIFLSGLTVGLVYQRVIEQHGLPTAVRRLLKRAWTLYVLAIGLTLVMLPASELLKAPWAVGVEPTTPLQIVWAIVSLHQTYYLVDVLALYVLLMLAAPLALLALSERRTLVLLAASWVIWAGFQVFPQQTELPWTTAGNNLFYLAAWQPLFFTAMAVGYHRQQLSSLVQPAWRFPLLIATGLGFAALIVVYSNQPAVLEAIQSWIADLPGRPAVSVADLEIALFAKGDVRPGRIVASAIVFAFLYLFTTLFWHPVRRATGWLLLAFGQNALYAYSAHIMLALAVGVFTAQAILVDKRALNGAIQIASIGLIWLAIRWRILHPTAENRRLWMASVVPLAVTACVAFGLTSAPTVNVSAAASEVPASETSASTSDAVRRARAFGTPIPRVDGASPGMQAAAVGTTTQSGAPLPVAEATPTPAPQVSTASGSPPAVAAPVAARLSAAEYVGPITGTFREITFYSPALDREMSYYIYLPPGYDTEGRRYPVLYMLHGGGGSKDEWSAYGLVNAVDRSIQSKDIRPMIVVMPQGDLGYWVNWANDGPRWGDYVARDVRRQVDATFRTLPDASHRAVGGLSMGGAGALQLAFNRPEVFHVAGAHSPSLHLDDGTFSGIYGTGEDFAAREPIELAMSATDIESLRIWIDTGEDDPWLERDQMLHENLEARGIAHNWSVLSGGHDGEYWMRNIPAYLRFYDSVLNWETVG